MNPGGAAGMITLYIYLILPLKSSPQEQIIFQMSNNIQILLTADRVSAGLRFLSGPLKRILKDRGAKITKKSKFIKKRAEINISVEMQYKLNI